jgi:hypothetical protein
MLDQQGAEWKGKFLAYDGPWESFKEIEGRNFETSMQEALRAAGYKCGPLRQKQFRHNGRRKPFRPID